MKLSIPWRRVFGEGVTIVVSILLALAIDAWWGNVQDRETWKGYAARLDADLQGDTANLSYLIGGLERKEAALHRLHDWGAGTVRTGDPPAVARTLLQAEQYGFGQFQASGTTFEDLQNTGNLHLVEDHLLRGALVDYYQTWILERGRIEARQSSFPSRVFDLIPIDFGETVEVPANSASGAKALDRRQVGTHIARDLAAAVRETSMQREIQHELNYAGFTRAALARLHRRAAEVLALLHEREE